jgi:hypothetical protein
MGDQALKKCQINTWFEGWSQDQQVMIGVAIQVGNFMSMVTSGEWWKIKKRYLSLSLDRGDRNRKGKRT